MPTAKNIIIYSFPHIYPINTVEEGISQGHFNDRHRHITNQTVPLQPARGEKMIHLVCFNRVIGETEYVKLLRAQGRQPCRHAPNYLLGLMARVPNDQMPPELRNKHIIAAEPDNDSAVFACQSGRGCFLCVYRRDASCRLSFACVNGGWTGELAFIAEDLAP